MHRRRLLSLALLLLITARGVSRADKVDDYVKSAMQEQRIVGLSLAVVKDGQTIKAEGYGMANVELGIPVKPQSVFKIGSVSKQFLASGIMLLVQDGQIGLDDPVGKYLEGTPESWKEITVRHFLTHTSGVLREAPGFEPFKAQNDVDVIKTAYAVPLRFSPGEKWEYCNVGYFALAAIIQKVSGKPWGEFMAERIFGPLGMTATRATNYYEIIPDRVNGYGWQQDKLRNAEHFLSVRPSGGFLSTALDMAKWDLALHTDQVLKPASREQMWTSVTLNDGTTHPYGFGWELSPAGSHRLVHHGGSLGGFQSEFARYVDDKLSVIVLTNTGNARPPVIAREIAALYIPDLIPNARFDVTGNWDFQTEIDGQKGTPHFIFKLQGHKLTGKYKGQYGEADLSGTVEGEKIQFQFRSPTGSAVYRGTLDDQDHMKGEASYGGPPGTWTGNRGS